MLTPILAIAIGLVILVWSAEHFVQASVRVAQHFGLSALFIGMVIVGFGTSAPELVVSLLAATSGNSGIALGNAYGSNICNIALILGGTALLRPMRIARSVAGRDMPILLGVSLVAAWQLHDLKVSRLDALLLLGLFAAALWYLARNDQKPTEEPSATHVADLPRTWLMPSLRLLGGLALLIASSRLLVWGAVELAQAVGVSDLVIGLTIVAVGTSLPELASSIIAARKGEHDIALGNIIGSNLFNTTVVVGIAGLVAPMTAELSIIKRDIPVMLVLTFALFAYAFWQRRAGTLGRATGGVMLASYIAYTAYLLVGP